MKHTNLHSNCGVSLFSQKVVAYFFRAHEQLIPPKKIFEYAHVSYKKS